MMLALISVEGCLCCCVGLGLLKNRQEVAQLLLHHNQFRHADTFPLFLLTEEWEGKRWLQAAVSSPEMTPSRANLGFCSPNVGQQ